MAIKTKVYTRKQEIDLDGPAGNAFCLLGYARTLSKPLKLDYEKIKAEMTSGDYENLIKVFDKYFGSVVDLVRSAPEDKND